MKLPRRYQPRAWQEIFEASKAQKKGELSNGWNLGPQPVDESDQGSHVSKHTK
jgi:hypothetical protein